MQQQDITPSTTAESPESYQGNKRRKITSTTRGVASLTPDQLAKKRANDREAQRAIRERTKAQIETLERRIQELTAQQPYQELQAVIRQKDAIQAENEEIKRRLTSILSIIQPLVGAQGLTELATAAHGNIHFEGNETGTQHHLPFLGGEGQPGSRPMSHRSSPHSTYSQWQSTEAQSASSDHRLWQSSIDALNNQRTNLHRGLELTEAGERLSFNFLLENQKNLPAVPPPTSSPYPPIPNAIYSEQPRSSWAALPKNLPPTCPLDGILLKFLHTRQVDPSRTDSPHSEHHQAHNPPSYPSVHSLLNPTSGPPADPLSQVMIDIISKFPGIVGLPQHVAILYLMFLLMRWFLHPTQQNYERLPEWLTPRPSQLFEAHPAWIDYVPWPKMRDKLVANYREYPFENWFIPFTTGISVNWPYEETDCLLITSEREEPIINPVFERHCMRIENWSIGQEFVDAFPALSDMVRVTEKR